MADEHGKHALTWRVVERTETDRGVTVTFAQTDWSFMDGGEDEAPEFRPAEPGEPGASWAFMANSFKVDFCYHEEPEFRVGQQFVMGLTEIFHAPLEEYEPA